MPGLSIRVRSIRKENIYDAAEEMGVKIGTFANEAIEKALNQEFQVIINERETGNERISVVITLETRERLNKKANEAGVRDTQWATFAVLTYADLVRKGTTGTDTKIIDSAFNNTDSLEMHGMGYRRQQHALARTIYEQLNDAHIGMCEAGTGTGKAYACLAAASAFSYMTGKKVVVSTFTRALQKQLLATSKTLKQISGINVKTALIYGKRNYVSPPKLAALLSDKDIDLPESEIKAAKRWMKTTKDWFLADLEEVVDPDIFPTELVAIHDDDKNPADKQPYIDAINAANDAGVIITSHHMMLYSMMKNSNPFNFKPENVVIDEAHLLENAAGSVFGKQLSFLSVNAAVKKLVGVAIREKRKTLTSQLMKWREAINVIGESIVKSTEQDDNSTLLMNRDYIAPAINMHKRELEILSKKPRFPKSIGVSGVELNSLYQMKKAADAFNQILDNTSEKEKYKDEIHATLSPVKRFVRIVSMSQCFVGNALNNVLWTKIRSASLLSATIYLPRKNCEDSPTEFINSVGLKNANVYAEPPFFESWIYDNLTIQSVTQSFPVPVSREHEKNSGDRDKWLNAVSVIINNLNRRDINKTHGGMMVLCTGYDDAIEISERLSEDGKRKIITYKRDDDMRKIQQQFMDANGNALLVALGGFWTGVDFPGQILTDLIIPRLPIMSGSDPMLLSRFKYLEKKNSTATAVSSILLPRMGRTLRQGVGRVIRTKDDHGRAYLLDARMHTHQNWRVKTILRKYEPFMEIPEDILNGH